ncbi:hypothetical protein LPB72_06565 [Hydrogenophaga crassostreae]|uniref:DUF2065 domain-containing protein n=1 Tax=Hydrogenophaga crassostreae TaxID=1763535 RepID=A0A167IDJ4_9BURK|nr:DUF2065 domain-containing protein [Hydrogenophaga crassostreae]AOW13270.1 DUF2065 domain-containing protein [Hydrogenophaga crassostreae]OAD42582.1 hypothetical protein LPB72_06565 [Hydrogenophaga crassostreae]
MSDTLWAALALFLILEGFLPFVAPGLWRRVFSEMLQMSDGQIRFFGLVCLVIGATSWWLMD